MPPEAEWFANQTNRHTKRAYRNAITDFMGFTGIARPEEFRTVRRAHVNSYVNNPVAGAVCNRQTRTMRRPAGDQGTLFDPAISMRAALRHRPPKQTAVFVSAEAIRAATIGRLDGERIIAAAIRSARPDARNIAVDLGTIRWTDPATGCRVTFTTPVVVRSALFALAGGAVPAPFRFTLGRPNRVASPVTPAGPSAPD